MSNGDPESALSPAAAVTPSWPRPRTPLPPHRLAKLANALGVSTPIPVGQSLSDSASSYSYSSVPRSSASSVAESWRSPTPSVASTSHLTSQTPHASTSRFLLHVVPPAHLPHDSDSSESLTLTPPPSTASGYHTQFRRGTLVPLFPTLQLQLWAIAKEYALPSTNGMILYLISTQPSRQSIPDAADKDLADLSDEPGPRLSEEIWKHLWTRVVKVEQDAYPSRAPTPNPVGVGLGFGGRTSPLSPESSTSRPNLRPLISPGHITPQPLTTPITPNPSTPSTSQGASSTPSQSDPATPDTSLPSGSRANSLDLPGLSSPSLIPILAKVEFDIDRRKAGWYEPWMRSRRVNHRKRVGRTRPDSRSTTATEEEGEQETVPRTAPINLKLVDRQAVPRFLWKEHDEEDVADEGEEYTRLSESPGDEDETAPLGTVGAQDPLADVFGSDGEVWADMHADGTGKRPITKNGNVVELALDGAALSAPPEDPESHDQGNDELEVKQLWDAHSRPRLSVAIPPSPQESPRDRRRSSPTTAGTVKKSPPPPLTLPFVVPNDVIAMGEPSPLPSAGTAKLAYLRDGTTPTQSSEEDLSILGDEEVDEATVPEGVDPRRFRRIKSPGEEKRVGAFFEDLDLGLEFEESGEIDMSDPNDRRRSQYEMSATLDEIERNFRQFSPRRLKHELDEEDEVAAKTPPRTTSLSPPSQPKFTGAAPGSPTRRKESAAVQGGVWPAVPFSALKEQDEPPASPTASSHRDSFPTPPRLALNGVSNAIPVSPYAKQRQSQPTGDASDESMARKREFEGQEPSYPDIVPPSLRKAEVSNSPVIPLSPDPFGRFPFDSDAARISEERSSSESTRGSRITYSTFEIPPERQASLNRDTSTSSTTSPRHKSQAPSSRFSMDSSDEPFGKNNNNLSRPSTTLNPVKSIRKLWRKSNNRSVSGSPPAPAATAASNGQPALASPPPLPNGQTLLAPQPSQQELVTNAMIPPRRQMEPPLMTTTQAMQRAQAEASISTIHFDQESPYPIRRSPQPPQSYQNYATPMSRPGHQQQASTSSRISTVSPPNQSVPLEKERSGIRKSILKSWRSPPNSLSQASGNPTMSSDGSRSSTPEGPLAARKRRPSVIEMAGHLVRGSVASITLSEIPPSPILPEQYASANATLGSRQSRAQSIGDNGKRFSVRTGGTGGTGGRNTPSSSMESSRLSSHSSPPPVRTPLGGSPPRPGRGPGISRPSEELDEFEIISPAKAGHAKTPSLSYPYNELDHQE